ncbi:hypothetical protein [Deinococcus hopiensis]|uniref:hypothetical protein n=1 Tax=Deinococcus hopiensis TaxID=309885 RepID=UPI001BAF24C7|nr:hypothetical protein [Deinococcus hopiensis]
MNGFLNVIRNHDADFTGRAREREYWMFALIQGVTAFLPLIAIYGALISLALPRQNGGRPPQRWLHRHRADLFPAVYGV